MILYNIMRILTNKVYLYYFKLTNKNFGSFWGMNDLKIWNWEINLDTSLLEFYYETFNSSQKIYYNKTP